MTHTDVNSALLHDMGFSALFFTSKYLQEYQLKNRFNPEIHESHFIWFPAEEAYGKSRGILGGILNPWMKEFKSLLYPFFAGNRGLMQTDPDLEGYNAPSKATDIINFAQETANSQANDENIMILVGDNFFFQNADIGYTQVRQIIEQGNKF